MGHTYKAGPRHDTVDMARHEVTGRAWAECMARHDPAESGRHGHGPAQAGTGPAWPGTIRPGMYGPITHGPVIFYFLYIFLIL